MANQVKVILIHGNNGSWPKKNWLPSVSQQLKKLHLKVIFRRFPDPVLARAKYWLPFIKKLGADKNTILIGHSSGALASMRYAEKHKILGSILVGACYTDLGVETERISGYYHKSWNWESIKKNQTWIVQFASTNDPHIPISEPRFIHRKLKTEYFESKTDGHFSSADGKTKFPEIITIVKKKLKLK